jgi:D-tagatose-1,6-bisphosphate aldolase subunit GatZ/KbaZ
LISFCFASLHFPMVLGSGGPVMNGVQEILYLVARHKAGDRVGITSVCSAHPLVIEATLRHALATGQAIALIEATSNQVNQDGGYTGMLPADFSAFVEGIAGRVGFPLERLALGGDHLGPNAWTSLPAEEAMAKAETLVAHYVRAGFRKIHLDCSMSCADDPVPLAERTVAERAARLCRAAESAHDDNSEEFPVYVIGTEVPVPGGAAENLGQVAVTSPEAALATLDMHRDLFRDAGIGAAWERVIATVVQPGVEFDHEKVVDYRPEAARALSAAIEPVAHVVYEAHSTDYQTPAALAALVGDHFAILKVGPGLTFALREALWALDAIEAETIPEPERAKVRETALARMRGEPNHWHKYYHAEGSALDLQLQYSLSDRIRYYWPHPEIAAAQERLFANLRSSRPSLALVSQHLPLVYPAVRAGETSLDPAELVMAHIGATLEAYYGACHSDA